MHDLNKLKAYTAALRKNGGSIKKLGTGGTFSWDATNNKIVYKGDNGYTKVADTATEFIFDKNIDIQILIDAQSKYGQTLEGLKTQTTTNTTLLTTQVPGAETVVSDQDKVNQITADYIADRNIKGMRSAQTMNQLGFNAINVKPQTIVTDEDGNPVTDDDGNVQVKGVSTQAQLAIGGTSLIAAAAANVVGNTLTEGKNFNSQSQSIDAGVNGVTALAMKSGNPYLMAGAAALTGLNQADKMFGRNMEGYDVSGVSGSYGDIGHQDSQAFRFSQMGFGNKDKIDAMLDRRNAQVEMALNARNISEQQEFQNEARMNEAVNVANQNNNELNGADGYEALAAKQGGKIQYAQDGAKLGDVELSEDKSIIPEGSLHKNKHNLDIDGITKKGITVLQDLDPNTQTMEDIKEQEGKFKQAAEIEEAEWVMSGELTEYIESKKKEFDESKDSELLLEVGKRLVAELLLNSDDNVGLIDTIKQKE